MTWDFSKPEECRAFLKQARFKDAAGNSAQILHLYGGENKLITIDDASDEQVLFTAKTLAESFAKKEKAGA